MQRVALRLALVVSACALSADRATGDVIISNLAGPNVSSTLFGPNSTTIFKAAGWTMPSGDDYFLDDVTLNLDFVSTGTAQVEIWSGVGVPSNPELILNSPPQNGAGNFTFTPPVPFVMEAEGTYWAYVTALPGSDEFRWISTSMAPTGLASSAGYIFNGNPSTYMNKYEVNGTVVPEPASLALFGLLGLAATRRR
jgi:hypothetical protein